MCASVRVHVPGGTPVHDWRRRESHEQSDALHHGLELETVGLRVVLDDESRPPQSDLKQESRDLN